MPYHANKTSFKKGRIVLKGDSNPRWKMSNVSYRLLHSRITRKYGSPKKCEICGCDDIYKRYEWANLTGDYENLLDYKRMCMPCHRSYDNERKKYGDLNHKNSMINFQEK